MGRDIAPNDENMESAENTKESTTRASQNSFGQQDALHVFDHYNKKYLPHLETWSKVINK